jgi:hypothetical protein
VGYLQLKGLFPPGIKGDRKEEYLTDEEFKKVFLVERADFDQLK